jgi:hypothetical protein
MMAFHEAVKLAKDAGVDPFVWGCANMIEGIYETGRTRRECLQKSGLDTKWRRRNISRRVGPMYEYTTDTATVVIGIVVSLIQEGFDLDHDSICAVCAHGELDV